MNAVLTRQPFLYVDPAEFVDDRGRVVRGVYDAFNARLAFMPSPLADRLDGDGGSANDEADRALERAGLLVADAASVRAAAYDRMDEAREDETHPIFVLLPTSYCNMGCAYCGQEHTKGSLGPDHRDRVVERVITRVRQPETERVSVRWFGGEPLMGFAAVRDMSRRLLQQVDAHGVGFSANMTTNGALLDGRKLRALVEDCRVTEFHITIDGPEAVHDAHRPLKSGGRSFVRLVTFLAEVAADRRYDHVKFVLRTNIDVENCDYVDEYLREMAVGGFSGRPNFVFSLIPVHPWGNDVSALRISMAKYASRESRWLELMHELGLNNVLLPSAPKAQTCGATNPNSEVISASGGVFSCTEQPLVPEHEADSVLISLDQLASTARRPVGEFDDWAGDVRDGAVPCSSCWMLPVCGGHCPKSWREGDAACPSGKFNMNARIAITARARGMAPLSASRSATTAEASAS